VVIWWATLLASLCTLPFAVVIRVSAVQHCLLAIADL